MAKAAFIYEKALSQHVLSEDHVLQPTRLEYTYQLLEAYKAFHSSSRVIVPRPVSDEEILTFHTEDYLKAVKSLSRGERTVDPASYGFSEEGDTPPYAGMYEAASLAVGASLTAAEMVVRGEADTVFNVAGGMHHAAPDFASGFCIFNDVVIIIKSLLKQGLRVACIDIDAHHGDGVQDAFYSNPQVLKISIHEWGRYLFPGTGEVTEIGEGEGKGFNVNIPVSPLTDDSVYLRVFGELAPPLLEKFKPDIVVSQLGCDTHYLDPLTHLNLTTEGYTETIREIKRLAPRWIALGGGGYDIGVVARSWTLAYGIMTGKEWDDEIPEEYRKAYGLTSLRDKEKPQVDAPTRDRVEYFAQWCIGEVKKLVFPLHGIK